MNQSDLDSKIIATILDDFYNDNPVTKTTEELEKEIARLKTLLFHFTGEME